MSASYCKLVKRGKIFFSVYGVLKIECGGVHRILFPGVLAKLLAKFNLLIDK